MRRAMATLRIGDPAALLRAAEQPGNARDVILAELTVGESYFFRDAGQLALLPTTILPARVDSYGAHRPLRIWSAGCASGEEAYTLAILLREQGWPHPAQILGTDVALPRLEAARRARYTRWALRGVSEERVARWFRGNGQTFELDPSIRESVAFRPLNLLNDSFASSEAGDEGYDLVLCRNVMIYFDLDTVAQIATRLLEMLNDDGWLVLGASDPMLAHLVPCEAVMTAAGVAYRKARHASALPAIIAPRDVTRVDIPWHATTASAIAVRQSPAQPTHERRAVPRPPVPPRPGDGADTVAAAYRRADYPATELMAIDALQMGTDTTDAIAIWILYIRAVANQGRLAEAGELCTRALDAHPLDAELQYLHAMLLAEAGWHADAAVAARRAIYLDRRFVMAHLLLGNALTRTGDATGARRAFENAESLLADVGSEAVVKAADGVPASRLRQIAAARLQPFLASART